MRGDPYKSEQKQLYEVVMQFGTERYVREGPLNKLICDQESVLT